MAKKQEVKAELFTDEQTRSNLDLSLTKRDIVQSLATKYEAAWREQKSLLLKRSSELGKQAHKITDQIDDELADIVTSTSKGTLEKFFEMCKLAFPKGSGLSQARMKELREYAADKKNAPSQCCLREEEGVVNVEAAFRHKTDGNSDRRDVSFTEAVRVPLTTALRSLLADRKKLTDDINAIDDQIADINVKLSRPELDFNTRRLDAQITDDTLAVGGGNAQMLARISANIQMELPKPNKLLG
jgi:hypothetical protein